MLRMPNIAFESGKMTCGRLLFKQDINFSNTWWCFLSLQTLPVSFQSYIYKLFKFFLDITVIVHLYKILVFLGDFSRNKKHVWEILKVFLKIDLYAKLSKCLFSVSNISFFSFSQNNSHLKHLAIEKMDKYILWKILLAQNV